MKPKMRITVNEFDFYNNLVLTTSMPFNGKLLYCASLYLLSRYKRNIWQSARNSFKCLKTGLVTNRNTTRILTFIYLHRQFKLNACLPFPNGKQPYIYIMYDKLVNYYVLFNVTENPLTTLSRNKRIIKNECFSWSAPKGYTSYYDAIKNELFVHDPDCESNKPKPCIDELLIAFYKRIKNDFVSFKNKASIFFNSQEFLVVNYKDITFGLDRRIIDANLDNLNIENICFDYYDENNLLIQNGIYVEVKDDEE